MEAASTVPETPNAQAAAQMEAHGAEQILQDDGIMAGPGTLRFELAGAYNQVTPSVPELDTSLAPEAALIGDLPTLLQAGLHAEAAWTGRIDRSGRQDDEAATLTLATRLEAGAALDTRGAGGLTEMLADSAAVFGSAESAYEMMSASMTDIETTSAALEETLSALESDPSNIALMLEAQQIGQDLEGQLNDAVDSLDAAGALLEDLTSLAGRMGDGRFEVRAGAVASSFVEQQVGLRSPTLQLGEHHRLDVAGAAHVVVPVPMGVEEQLAGLDDLVEIKSSMVALRAYVDVTVEGLDQLSESATAAQSSLQQLRDTAEASATMMGEANADPMAAAADPGFADRAASLTTDLEAQGAELEKHLTAMSAALDVQTEVGVEVVQVTAGVGAGLDEMSLRWRFNPNESFELAVRGYVQHAFGQLGAEATDLTLDEGTGELTATGTRAVNAYSDFFPRTAGLDVAATFNEESARTTRLVGGVATDGRALAAHLGLSQEIGRLTLRAGVTDPDLLRGEGHRFAPTAGLDLELGSRRQVVLQAAGTMGLNLDSGVEGGGGQLSVTFRK